MSMPASRIFVAGHRGLVGSAIARMLVERGIEVITCQRDRLDLTDQGAVRDFMSRQQPDAVVIAAARVGGIAANITFPAEFLHDNLVIEANLIHAAHMCGVSRLIQIASSAVYPEQAPQPLREDALLTGPLDPSHEPYALAKIAGIRLCDAYNRQHGHDFRSVVPTNLYGPGDNFHAVNAHVVPAMIRRFAEAKASGLGEVTIWGSGTPRRELLHVDDMAQACLHVLDLPRETFDAHVTPQCRHVNVGTGTDVSILELAHLIAESCGFAGAITTDPTRPDGVARRLLDVSRLTRLGWTARIGLAEGVAQTCAWYQANAAQSRGG